MPCRNSDGRVSHCGEAVAACPLAASDSPTPAMADVVNAHAIRMPGLFHAHQAMAITTIAINSDGPREVASAPVHGADVTMPARGRLRRSRPCRPSEATALTRPTASAPRLTIDPLGPCPTHAAKNVPPTPTNSPR
jgi:hypothetical protein